MDQRPDDIFTVSRLEQIPYLVHGFGTEKWRESDLTEKLKGKDFRLLFLNQIHSNIVHFIDEIPSDNLDGDALITRLPRLLMVIKTADCLPVLMVEEFIKEHSGEYKKRALWEHLPKKMMYQTYCVIFDYLADSGKVGIDKEGKIAWVWNPELVKKYLQKEELFVR